MIRLSAIILSFAYLLINSGLHIDLHFCDDELTEVSLNHDEEHCVKEVMECCINCDDVHLNTDNENDQFVEAIKKAKNKFSVPIVPNQSIRIEFNSLEQRKDYALFYSDSSPPDKDLYKLNCQFCFYG